MYGDINVGFILPTHANALHTLNIDTEYTTCNHHLISEQRTLWLNHCLRQVSDHPIDIHNTVPSHDIILINLNPIINCFESSCLFPSHNPSVAGHGWCQSLFLWLATSCTVYGVCVWLLQDAAREGILMGICRNPGEGAVKKTAMYPVHLGPKSPHASVRVAITK